MSALHVEQLRLVRRALDDAERILTAGQEIPTLALTAAAQIKAASAMLDLLASAIFAETTPLVER